MLAMWCVWAFLLTGLLRGSCSMYVDNGKLGGKSIIFSSFRSKFSDLDIFDDLGILQIVLFYINI